MKIRLLPSAFPPGPGFEPLYMTSYLINESVAVDAGSIGFFGGPEQQGGVRHILLTHSHIDHVASLPLFLENSFRHRQDQPVQIYGNAAVLDSLQRDLFNDRVWPDFIEISKSSVEFLRLHQLDAEVPIEIEGLRILPVTVDHPVPTYGFIVEDEVSCVVIPSDTGPTERIWELANQRSHVDVLFLEASFPHSQQALADLTKHLTPRQFAVEVGKLNDVRTPVAVHIKAPYAQETIAELQALGVKNLEIGNSERVFEFAR